MVFCSDILLPFVQNTDCLICKQTAVFPPYDNGIELVDMAQAIVEEIILKRNRFFGVTQLDQN